MKGDLVQEECILHQDTTVPVIEIICYNIRFVLGFYSRLSFFLAFSFTYLLSDNSL